MGFFLLRNQGGVIYKMSRKKFLRAGYWRYSKLGLRRKKKQVYRKAKGGDNKVRLNEKGRLKKVKIGYKKEKNKRGLVRGLKPVLVFNLNDLKKIKEGEIAVIAKIGNKKKLDVAKYSQENKIDILNLNAEKLIEKIEKIKERKKEKKKLKLEKEKDKKAREKEKEDKKKEEKKSKEEKKEKLEDKVGEKEQDKEEKKEVEKEKKNELK